MGCLSNFCGGNGMWWILILLLIVGNDGECNTCDSLIWILLLSRYCGGESSCGCGCQSGCGNSCGSGCGTRTTCC